MKLQISYDPESDTLDIGNGLPGSDGQPVADRLTAFFGEREDAVGITLENAIEVLTPYLGRYLVGRALGNAMTDTDLEIEYFPQTDTLDIGNGCPSAEGYDVADNLTAHVDHDGDVVFVTLEHAVEVLAPYLNRYMADREWVTPASVLRDEGEPA